MCGRLSGWTRIELRRNIEDVPIIDGSGIGVRSARECKMAEAFQQADEDAKESGSVFGL